MVVLAYARRYAAPISLSDLVDEVTLLGVASIAASLPGAQMCDTKHNESFRYQIADCFIIGYKYSATVAGEDSARMQTIDRWIRAVAKGESLSVVPDSVGISVQSDDLGEPAEEYVGASYMPEHDYTEQWWCAAYHTVMRLHPRLPRTMRERLADPLDPFAWAKANGLC